MIIQYNPAASDLEVSPASQGQSFDPVKWIDDRPNNRAPIESNPDHGGVNKIIDFRSADHPEEPTLYPNYIEEVKAKRFQGTNSISLHFAEELLAVNQEYRAVQMPTGLSRWDLPHATDYRGADESLPDAA